MIGIVAAEFNETITGRLLEGVKQELTRQKVAYMAVRVPGAVELPLVAQNVLEREDIEAVIALGCVIKGETDHYDMVLRSCTDGLTRVALDTKKPVIQGVLACRTFSDAWDRRNLGTQYAQSALSMVKILDELSRA